MSKDAVKGIQPPHDECVPADKIKVFVSYSRRDGVFVGQLVDSLSARDDIHVFRDTDDILPSEEWKRRLANLISQADTIVFCLSPNSATSDVCRWEVEHAEGLNKRIVPVVLKDVQNDQTPEGLAKLNYIFFDSAESFRASLDSLVRSLHMDIGWIREHTRIGELAQRWVQNGKRRDQLIRGLKLYDAEQWSKYRPGTAPELSDSIASFIAASRREIVASQRRIWRNLAITVVMIAAVGVGAFTYERWFPTLDATVYRLANIRLDLTKPRAEFKECSVCPAMVVVPAGAFKMGSPITEDGREENEGPQRDVTIGYAFAVSKFEVTFEEWDACVAANGCANRAEDNNWGRGNQPLINISWNDVTHQYLPWLSRLTGHTYRLLSEAEWEYVARAGSKTRYWWENEVTLQGEPMANCTFCGSQWDRKQTAPVGSFKANPFGLYDVHGNVSEWVQDCFDQTSYTTAPSDGSAAPERSYCNDPIGGSPRTHRGGSWVAFAENLRSAYRSAQKHDLRYLSIGLRIARDLSPIKKP